MVQVRRRTRWAAVVAAAGLLTGAAIGVGSVTSALESSGTEASSAVAAADNTPLAANGPLHVCGVNLCNQSDEPVQLRGASTHGLQWFDECYNTASLDALANDWNADVFRIAMYVDEGGYTTDPAGFTARVNELVDEAEARGMYAIIDFHTLTPGDPNANLENARTFFQEVATRNADKEHVIYEIANEPNGVSWEAIQNYANEVIPVVRAADPDSVVIVGTRGWSSLGVSDGSTHEEILENPIGFDNILYAFHFYAASHQDNYRDEVRAAAQQLPLFVSEWGTVSATGDGAPDIASSTAWLDLLDELGISHVNWTYSDAGEGSAAFQAGTCAGSEYGEAQLSESGRFVRDRVMN